MLTYLLYHVLPVQRTVMQPDELSSETLYRNPGPGLEEEIISTYEEAYRRIKETTGVTNVQVGWCTSEYILYPEVLIWKCFKCICL